MAGAAFFLTWASVAIWATWFVSGRVSSRGTRTICNLLIWLVPFVGAAAVVIVIGFGRKPKSVDSNDQMFDEVVEARSKVKD